MKSAWSYFQKALYEELIGDATLMGMVNDIGTWPDPDTPLPHISIGEETSKDWNDKFQAGDEIETLVHVWTETRGWRQSKEIADQIKRTLKTNTLLLDVVSGMRSIGPGRMYSPGRTINEDGGKIKHIVLPFSFRIHEI